MKYLKPFNESKTNEDFQEIDFMQWNKLIYGENFRDHYYQYNNIFLSAFANTYKSVAMKNWKKITDSELNYLKYKIQEQQIEIKNDEKSDSKEFLPYYKYKTDYQKKFTPKPSTVSGGWSNYKTRPSSFSNTFDIIFNWNLTIIKTEDDWFAVKLIMPTTTNIDLEKNLISIDFGELDKIVSTNRNQGRRLIAMYFKCDQIYGLRKLIDWIYEQIKIK
jgi:hypothetical protein